MAPANYLYDFNQNSAQDWRVLDDGVMGGRSQGNYVLNENGNGVFKGFVSLENNGGFSSILHRLDKTDVSNYKALLLRVKGDGKQYKFYLKSDASNYFFYTSYFETNGEWQTIKLPFKDFFPSFRGRRLRMPNFDGQQIEEIRFLIANKKAEDFQLEVDWIGLE